MSPPRIATARPRGPPHRTFRSTGSISPADASTTATLSAQERRHLYIPRLKARRRRRGVTGGGPELDYSPARDSVGRWMPWTGCGTSNGTTGRAGYAGDDSGAAGRRARHDEAISTARSTGCEEGDDARHAEGGGIERPGRREGSQKFPIRCAQGLWEHPKSSPNVV